MAMMNNNVKIELLAPAGDFSCFMAAINAGADAVYLGGNKFGARAYANNFSQEEIIEALKIAHLFGKRIYLTVNTLVKEKEMSELIPYLQPLYDAGLDGVIVQDLGVFQMIKKHFPAMELHASTQMTITGVYGAKFLKKLGACRIVPARELSLEEIEDIKKETGLEIETFIHGAMCYGYSGQCLFSSILGGRSGNRGRCAGPCRLPYKDTKGNTVYPLSLKDMYTLPLIPKLIEAGIDSFKIEGRMKSPEYVAGVTSIYRKYIDLYLNNPEKPYKIAPDDEKILHGLYIRSDTSTGYYTQHNNKAMVTLKEPGYSGCSDEVLQSIRTKYLDTKRTLPVKGNIRIVQDKPSELTLSCNGITVSKTGEMASSAMNRPLTRDDIQTRICKLGDTFFQMEELIVETDGASFMPVKSLNELRRQACTALEEALVSVYSKRDKKTIEETQQNTLSIKTEPVQSLSLMISVMTYEQLKTVLLDDKSERISGMYLSTDLFLGKDSQKVMRLMQEHSEIPYYLAMPNIIRKRSYPYLEQLEKILQMPSVKGVLIRNLEALQWLMNIHYKGEYIADYSVYAWNKEILSLYDKLFSRITVPVELNKKEIYSLGDLRRHELLLYGRLPLMYSANCVRKTLEHCENKVESRPDIYCLTDRYQNRFPILQNCLHCYNILYNTVPLSLHGQWKSLLENHCAVYRIEFTLEDAQETANILDYYMDLVKTVENGDEMTREFPFKDFTNGHYKRGVE